jgi:hypothetical protein
MKESRRGPIGPGQLNLVLRRSFAQKYLRTVGLDNVVTFAKHQLHIEADQRRRSYARAEVARP